MFKGMFAPRGPHQIIDRAGLLLIVAALSAVVLVIMSSGASGDLIPPPLRDSQSAFQTSGGSTPTPKPGTTPSPTPTRTPTAAASDGGTGGGDTPEGAVPSILELPNPPTPGAGTGANARFV